MLRDIPRFVEKGWEAIPDGDRERLKWAGVFFRRQTPGHCMMRVRIPNGISNAHQVRALAELSEKFGKGFADITTGKKFRVSKSQSGGKMGSGSCLCCIRP